MWLELSNITDCMIYICVGFLHRLKWTTTFIIFVFCHCNGFQGMDQTQHERLCWYRHRWHTYVSSRFIKACLKWPWETTTNELKQRNYCHQMGMLVQFLSTMLIIVFFYQEYPAIYSVKYLFFSNFYLAGIFTEQKRSNIAFHITLCYTQKYTWKKMGLLYKLDHADYESEL